MSLELDDLLNEMLAESEAALNVQPTIQQTTTTTPPKISFQEQMPNSSNNNNNNNNSTSEKRKSRLSQHPNNINEGGGFDYLDTLLNDMSDESIRNSIKPDNSRIKSLRLTSTFDLESTLKDLEETFMKDSSVQNKRKPSSYLSKNLSPSSINPTTSNESTNETTNLPPPPVSISSPVINEPLTLPPPPVLEQLPPYPTESISSSPLNESVKSQPPVLKRVSSEKAMILTKEAIDAADLLDEMIESFGGMSEENNRQQQQQQQIKPSTIPTPIMTPVAPTTTTTTTSQNKNVILNLSKSPNGTLKTRPAAKLGAPVDIQSSSPKAPTPIPTLSSPSPQPVSPTFKDSDQLLDDMISHFKENNSNLLTSSVSVDPKAPGVTYVSQQHYPLSVEEQQLVSKQTKIVQPSVDEDIVSKILGDNDLDDDDNGIDNREKSHSQKQLLEQQQQDKSWYIKPQPSDVIGQGNNGVTQRAGIHKDKRIVMKTWNFITSQATPMLFNEVEQLIAIKHPNILPLVGASFDNNFISYTEYITGSNLDIAIKNLDEKNELQLIIRLSEEIATAMAFLHSFNIVHRSLHPKNILLNSDLKIYIKDFGFTSLKDETLKKKLSSIPLVKQNQTITYNQYLAPELFNVLSGSKGGYDTKVDVFSFGVLLWEMFARDTIKLSDLKSSTINGYTHYLRPPLANCPFTIEKLIKLCLSTDPNVRPTFITILKVLRQPLHTIQRFTKQPSINDFNQTSQSEIDQQKVVDENIKNEMLSNSGVLKKPINESLDQEKRNKILRISNVVKELIDEPTLLNLHRASQTIDSLCKNLENIEYLLDTNFIELLFQLIDQPYDEIQLACLKQFSILIENSKNEDTSNQFRNLLGINILIESLKSNNEMIIFANLKLLSQLTSNTENDNGVVISREENREQVLIKGGIPLLINLLSHQNELVKLQVIWCITMLLESPSIQNEFVKLGGVDQLIDMMVYSTNSGFDLRITSALSRVISLKSVQDQINNGNYRERVIKKYLLLLGDTNFEALRMIGLEALACLVSNKDNQLLLTENNIISLLIEYLDPSSTLIAPQMTALKIILLLSVNSTHIQYLKSTNVINPLQYLKTSPHPSIQKAVEKILLLLSK